MVSGKVFNLRVLYALCSDVSDLIICNVECGVCVCGLAMLNPRFSNGVCVL